MPLHQRGGAEFAYRLGVAAFRYGHVVAGGAAVDAGGIGLDALEQAGIDSVGFGLGGPP
jgi:hypothetical protein